MADIRINSLPTTASASSSDDFLALDGATNGTRKLNAYSPTFGGSATVGDLTLGTSGPSVKSSLSARAPRQGLVFDSATSQTTFSAIAAPGTGDFAQEFRVRFSDITTRQLLASGDTSGTATPQIALSGAGTITLQVGGGAAVVTSSTCLTAGQTAHIVITRSSGVSKIYCNGIEVGSGADTNNYTTGLSHLGHSSVSLINAAMTTANFYNRALSASEVVALYEAGAPAGADYVASGQTAGTSVVGTSFASGWSTDGGFTAGTNAVFTSSGNAYKLGVLVSGKRYRFSVEIVSADAGAILQYYNGSSYVSMSTAGSTGVKTVEFTASGTTFVVAPAVGSGGLTLTAPSVNPIGLLLAPDAAQAGGGLVWYDTSGNAANITLPASGVSWNVPSSRVLGGNWTTSGTLTVNGGTANLSAPSPDSFTLNYLSGTSSVGSVVVNPGTGELRTSMGPAVAWGGFQTWYTDTVERMRILANGNVFIGKTSGDTGDKLQVSGSAIFGSTNTAQLSNPTGQIIRQQFSASTVGLRLEADSANGHAVIGTSSNHSLLLRSNDTTALTLDSSQNATFEGNVTINKSTPLYGLAVSGSRKGFLYFDGTNTILGTDTGSVVLSSNSGNVVINNGQALQLGNAYVAGAPTATGYITIKDSSGTTYKVPVVAA